jgi:transposase
MMGHPDRSEALFYYFRLEDQIPQNHLLRLIDKHISFEFARRQLKDSYSDTGRPSIDPELLLRRGARQPGAAGDTTTTIGWTITVV